MLILLLQPASVFLCPVIWSPRLLATSKSSRFSAYHSVRYPFEFVIKKIRCFANFREIDRDCLILSFPWIIIGIGRYDVVKNSTFHLVRFYLSFFSLSLSFLFYNFITGKIVTILMCILPGKIVAQVNAYN